MIAFVLYFEAEARFYVQYTQKNVYPDGAVNLYLSEHDSFANRTEQR